MTYSRDTTRLTPSEIEELREDNRQAGALARKLIRAEKEAQKGAEQLPATMQKVEDVRSARR